MEGKVRQSPRMLSPKSASYRVTKAMQRQALIFNQVVIKSVFT